MIKDITKLSDQKLLLQIKEFVAAERDNTYQVISHLREVDRRKLYSDLKYKSLFDYAVNGLGYAEGPAHRRVVAARMTKELPALEEKIKEQQISLTNINIAKTFFNDQKITDSNEKMKIIETLVGKSGREAEKALQKINQANPKRKKTIIRTQGENSRVHISLTCELMEKLDRVKGLLASKLDLKDSNDLAKIIEVVTDIAIEKLDPAKKTTKEKSIPITNETNPQKDVKQKQELPVKKKSRYIPEKMRSEIFRKAGSKCEKCGSTYLLQIHHKKPYAVDGKNSLDNLMVVCKNCNDREGIKFFGIDKYLSSRSTSLFKRCDDTCVAKVPLRKTEKAEKTEKINSPLRV